MPGEHRLWCLAERFADPLKHGPFSSLLTFKGAVQQSLTSLVCGALPLCPCLFEASHVSFQPSTGTDLGDGLTWLRTHVEQACSFKNVVAVEYKSKTL